MVTERCKRAASVEFILAASTISPQLLLLNGLQGCFKVHIPRSIPTSPLLTCSSQVPSA